MNNVFEPPFHKPLTDRKWMEVPTVRLARPKDQPLPRAAKFADQAVMLTEKQMEAVMQWWSMTEKYETESKLARRLHEAADIEPMRILVDTFCNRGSCRRDQLNMLTQYISCTSNV